jgi:ribA/ribD-fused uncharacterized protein
VSNFAGAMVQESHLKALWAECGSSPPAASFPTVEFYGHRPASGALRCFSNFYEHPPCVFVVPPSCGAEALVAAGRPHHVPVTFTEKAIMLCKASIIGDYKMYGQIQAAASPQEAKALRRSVSPFVPARWDALVCEVARAVCVQKALGVPELHARLLETGERVIAEMTRNDCNWGTGLDIGHKDASMPSRWPGTNTLGWTLMQASAEMAAAAGSSGATRGGGRGMRWWHRRPQRRPATTTACCPVPIAKASRDRVLVSLSQQECKLMLCVTVCSRMSRCVCLLTCVCSVLTWVCSCSWMIVCV